MLRTLHIVMFSSLTDILYLFLKTKLYPSILTIHRVMVMVYNATFNNISVISWWSVCFSGGNRSARWKQPTSRKSLTN